MFVGLATARVVFSKLASLQSRGHSNSKNETVHTTLYVSSEPESEPHLIAR